MKLGNKYYYITDKGAVGKAMWLNDKRDRYRKLSNNVYKTFAEIKPIAERIKNQLTSIRHFIA